MTSSLLSVLGFLRRDPATKKCASCKQILPASKYQFSSRLRKPFGTCMDCRKKQAKEACRRLHQKRNRKTVQEANRLKRTLSRFEAGWILFKVYEQQETYTVLAREFSVPVSVVKKLVAGKTYPELHKVKWLASRRNVREVLAEYLYGDDWEAHLQATSFYGLDSTNELRQRLRTVACLCRDRRLKEESVASTPEE